ncbi:MAG: SWIB/MDM2 domain-containing protein [Rhodoferax sp.]|nr:SWIB/MDM2 domain-containing protein [Rhodoferax sp.]
MKEHSLQDKTDGRLINADAKLRKVFGEAQVSMFKMAGLLSKHLEEIEPPASK